MFDRARAEHCRRVIFLSLTGLVMWMGLTATSAWAKPRAKPASPVTLERSDAALYGAALAGRYAQATNNPQLAAQAWTGAFKRQQSDVNVFARALAAQLQLGDMTEALALARLKPKGFESEEASLVLAVDAFARGRFKEASTVLAKTKFQPRYFTFANQIAAFAILEQNQLDKALEMGARNQGAATIEAQILVSRVLLLQRAGRDKEASTLFDLAMLKKQNSPAAIVAYADWLVSNNRAEEAKGLYERNAGLGGLAASSFGARLAQLETIGDTVPAGFKKRQTVQRDLATGLLTLTQSLMATGSSGSTATLLAWVHHIDPSYSQAKLALADQWIANGRPVPATDLLGQIQPDSPDFVAARSELVWQIFATDQTQAVKRARDTARLAPDDPLAARLLADALAADKQDVEAESIYTRLIEQAEAREETQDNIWPLYFGRGGTRERQGRWDLAYEDLRKAKDGAPQNPNVLNYLGYALADRGQDLDEAITMLRTAVRMRPNSGAIQDSLGWALVKAGKYDEALTVLEEAAQRAPQLAEVSDHLGDAYWLTARKSEAKLEWARALRLSSDPAQGAKIAHKLANGLPRPQSASATKK